MENQKAGWAANAFTDHVKHGRNADHTLNVIVLAWTAVERAMRPVIGKGGVDALFHRCIDETSLSHPWVRAAVDHAHPAMDIDMLRSVLSELEPIHFAAASDALLMHFHHLLANLIGLSLTERLLRPVLDPLLDSLAAKDI